MAVSQQTSIVSSLSVVQAEATGHVLAEAEPAEPELQLQPRPQPQWARPGQRGQRSGSSEPDSDDDIPVKAIGRFGIARARALVRQKEAQSEDG